ncbi:ATP-binding protein [Streptomyces sp. CA-210063]|uniref:AAA family ATPase n=1 Tax=Streptomyces sp. CA-210063 TaxID=2801029 RepID=UPI00214CEE5B|nr:AAA family ATPase [Streptomyces sp. CA-210063]UUU30799.1 ATP-binding protein [Streptomyces sp. CA-210063]
MSTRHRRGHLPGAPMGREYEWTALTGFLTDPAPAPAMRLATISGPRRIGKSYLLHALCEAVDGLYFTAISDEGRQRALYRFTEMIAAHARVAPDTLRPRDWREALTNALDVTSRCSPHPFLVLDDFPHLLSHSPELPQLIEELHNQPRHSEDQGARLILSGTARGGLHESLSDGRPLRGRAVIDLRLGAFDYRTSRDFWQLDDPHTALHVHSVLGGAPGYRLSTGRTSPLDGFDTWVTETLLNPGRAIYSRTEAEFLLREDPRITQHTLYYDILTAIARGATTPTKIGAALGRQRNTVTHPLDVLESTGYIHREQDLLRRRQPVITLADPVIRFNQLITLPQAAAVEQGFADEVWKASASTFNSKILGPHYESLARSWTLQHAHAVLPDGLPGPVGTTEVPDPAARTRHEVDVIALSLGERPQSPRARIALLGEVKATAARRGVSDLQRLEHIRDLLSVQGYDTSEVTLALFSLYGFHADVTELAKRRPDVLLVDLETLYGL